MIQVSHRNSTEATIKKPQSDRRWLEGLVCVDEGRGHTVARSTTGFQCQRHTRIARCRSKSSPWPWPARYRPQYLEPEDMIA